MESGQTPLRRPRRRLMWLVFAPPLVVIILISALLVWKWISGLPLPFDRTQWDAQRTGYEQDYTSPHG